MRRRLIGVMTVLMAASLVACIPITGRREKGTAVATVAKSQKNMMLPSTGEASNKIPDLNVMSIAMTSVYYGGGGSLVQDMDSLDMEGLDAQLPVDKLIEYGVLTNSTKVLSFDVEGEGKNIVGALDLSQAGSVEGCSDKMFLIETGNTSTENSESSRLKLKVNGVNYEDDGTK